MEAEMGKIEMLEYYDPRKAARAQYAAALLCTLVQANIAAHNAAFNLWPQLASDAVMGADALMAELDKADR